MSPGVCASASFLTRLRVLLVEDCADHAQLILDALRHKLHKLDRGRAPVQKLFIADPLVSCVRASSAVSRLRI